MPFFDIDAGNALYYDYHPPKDGKVTFVFCNSMGLSTDFWRDNVTPTLRQLGFGTMAFDYRGQGRSRYDDSATLEPDEIVADMVKILAAVRPARAVLVGISIGGQFAAQAVLKGAEAVGLVMSNSLRKAGPHTDWIIELENRLIEMGGLQLAQDALSPAISSKEALVALRPTHLPDGGYEPWPAENPRLRIGWGLKKYRWDVEYEKLTLPVLVMTGLHDRLFRVQEDVDELFARLPNAQSVVFPDGGHVLHRELPAKLVDTFSRFAAQL